MRCLKKGIEKLKNVILSKKILLNFYRELNVNFSLSLKNNIDSLTFLNAINFYFKVFYKVSNVLFIFTVQIISFQSFSLFFIENIVNFKVNFKVFTYIYAVLFTFVHNGASYNMKGKIRKNIP